MCLGPRRLSNLSNRTDQLDYLGASAAELPVVSGEIKSAHRHIL